MLKDMVSTVENIDVKNITGSVIEFSLLSTSDTTLSTVARNILLVFLRPK